ncbi:ATP-binding protein [Corynebacterium belfantii]|uniref:ATP-binding protein n=1 Tax=Corynebacterium belfantii TaxID=2014537 RepID=UPI002E193BD9
MIPDKNPFRPSFGASPVQLAGREFEISSFNYGLLGGVGAMQRALLVSGTRGVGKTVLLNEFEESARRLGWVVIRAYVDAQMVVQLRDSTISGSHRGAGLYGDFWPQDHGILCGGRGICDDAATSQPGPAQLGLAAAQPPEGRACA